MNLSQSSRAKLMKKIKKNTAKKKLFLPLLLLATNGLNAAITVIGNSDAAICYRQAELGSSSKSSILICLESLSKRSLSEDLHAATRVNLGIIYNNSLKPYLALEQFALAVENDFARPEAYLNQGNSFFLIKDFSVALEKYKISLVNNIKDISAVYFNMGLTYENLGNFKEAVKHYKKSISIKPGHLIFIRTKERLIKSGQWKAEEKKP